jgi:hypothetical protein
LVRIGVEVVIRQTTNAGEGGFALLMIVLRDGAEFMRGAVELSGPSPVGGSVQSGRLSYRGAVVIDPAVPGAYVVALEPTVGMTGEPESVELVVTAPAIEWDPRLQPIGYVLIAVGFIGLVIAVARPGRRVAEKPPQRWGRGGGS